MKRHDHSCLHQYRKGYRHSGTEFACMRLERLPGIWARFIVLQLRQHKDQYLV